MRYDFDTPINRRNTFSFKWDCDMDYFGRDDVIPMWVADMDFACAPCIVEAVQKRAAHPVYGYGVRQQPYYDAVMGWLKKRHGFEVNYEHLAFAPPGVIYAMNVVLRILTKPGDRVMVPMPNYDPLFDMVTRGGRKLVETPLVWKDGRYTFDFADMEAKAASGVKVLVLSSPHNPTGRVWTRQELEGVAEICLRHNIFMLVDEIHCDFVPPEHPHTTFGLLGEEVLRHSMVCYSSNKGFNLGGLGMATLVLADDDLRCKFNEEMSIAQTRLDNIFGMAALIAAYNDGEEWLDQAIAYVSDNKAYLEQFLRERIPQIRMIPSEGTYLVWLDCSQLPYRGMALEHFMINEAKVAFCAGYEFGEQGEAFLRMNVACPRCTLTKALEQMEKDFACAPCIVEAVQKRAAHPVYGYGVRQQPYYDAVMGWLKKRHGFEVNYEHLAFAPPGVIYAMNVVLRILTKPGDRVMVPMPNYDPLFDMVTRGGRKLVETPLVWKDGRYTFDFADMEAKAASGVKVLVLSSPHNPTGRVWTRQELEGVAEICLRHNIFMLVDEIHCDFVPPEHPHTTFGLLGEEVLRHSMVCYSSNKGFNLGGLGMATLVLADDDLRCKFNEEMSIAQTRLDNIFGMAALIAAYNDGEEWLDQAIAYVSDNKAYLEQFLRERIPQIRMIPSEGTYLVWLDCSQLPYRGMALEHFMINEAKVAFCAGYEFGEQGEAFLRMNVACPRCPLTKALEQMEKAINGLSLQ